MESRDILVGGRADDVWDERWKALNLAIDTMLKDYGQVPDASRLKTLRPLLLCLQAFARKRFTDFHSGFLTQRLKTWPDFPPDAVFSSILDQVGFDIAVIDRAILQRVSGTSLMQERLALADRLAWSALQLAVSAGLLYPEKLPTVVTYFQKSPDIRVIPYAPVALLGIPYSCQQLDRDLLATPHEVGHYVFGHGVYGEQPLRKYLLSQVEKIVPDEQSPDYQRLVHWFEETFADVYGVCVAGPVMALDFQDLQLHAGSQRFINDDNDHPAPVLRPRIHVQVLRKRDPENWAAWADVLARNWEGRLQERERIDHLGAEYTAGRAGKLDHFDSNNRQVAVADTISESASPDQDVRPLDQLVTAMLKVLESGKTQPWYRTLPGVSAAGSPASQREALAQTTERLYTTFHDFVFDPPTVEPDKLDPLLNVDLGTRAGQSTVIEQWLAADQRKFPLGSNVVPGEWAPYFAADGWTTEGPQDRWP